MSLALSAFVLCSCLVFGAVVIERVIESTSMTLPDQTLVIGMVFFVILISSLFMIQIFEELKHK